MKKAICPKARVIMMKCTPVVRIAMAPVTSENSAAAPIAAGSTRLASVTPCASRIATA